MAWRTSTGANDAGLSGRSATPRPDPKRRSDTHKKLRVIARVKDLKRP
jgi:hypothetical protein